MTFRLYNAASGGSALYSETQLSVGVANGNFNAVIGSVSPIALPFDVPYWLTVAINADPEMSPRQPLSSSPYAFRAARLDSTATIVGTQVTGNVASADFANSAGSANVATTSMMALGLMGFLPGSQISGAITSATVPAAQITGTIGGAQLAATQRLPTVACAVNEVAQWNGSAWVCAAGAAGPVGPQGPQGNPGIDGAAGPQGPAGPNDIAGNLTMVNSTATEGNILKGTTPFIHNFGSLNTFVGRGAGNFVLTGSANTAHGANALASVASASNNTASGTEALRKLQSGSQNNASGAFALSNSISASNNTAFGAGALIDATGSNNTALGSLAGLNITSGGNNIHIGNFGLASDANAIRVGTAGNQTSTFIAGISGVTPALAALPVVIDSNGQLGTATAAASGVTSVATGAGLSGGPITSMGTINLASTQLLPVSACTTNQIPKWSGSAWTCGVDIDTNSGGTVTSITAGGGLTGGTITSTGTLAVDPASTVLTNNFFKQGGNGFGATATLGSTTNVAVEIVANGTRALRIEPNATSPNIAHGHSTNIAGGVGIVGTTVSGGGLASFPNAATNNYATVAGGFQNAASGNQSTISGGSGNNATIAYATVGGGQSNNATANSATVGGGFLNTASGASATVPGGQSNQASGSNTFAAGFRARAIFDGCFAWGDISINADFDCVTTNSFNARVTGGVYFRTNTALTNGCSLSPGGGAWSCTSSRETKKDFTAMNPLDVLKRVIDLPVTQWRYQAEVSGARHVGPMAEDFHAAFGLGDSDKTINVIDASGVALAAIQGLNQLVGEKDAQIQTQDKRIKLLEDALAAIESKLGMR